MSGWEWNEEWMAAAASRPLASGEGETHRFPLRLLRCDWMSSSPRLISLSAASLVARSSRGVLILPPGRCVIHAREEPKTATLFPSTRTLLRIAVCLHPDPLHRLRQTHSFSIAMDCVDRRADVGDDDEKLETNNFNSGRRG